MLNTGKAPFQTSSQEIKRFHPDLIAEFQGFAEGWNVEEEHLVGGGKSQNADGSQSRRQA